MAHVRSQLHVCFCPNKHWAEPSTIMGQWPDGYIQHNIFTSKVWCIIKAHRTSINQLERSYYEMPAVAHRLTISSRHGCTANTRADGGIRVQDIMLIIAHNYHVMKLAKRYELNIPNQFYYQLPLTPLKRPTLMQFPADPTEPPSQHIVDITIVCLYEAFNSSEDVRLEITYTLQDANGNRISHSAQTVKANLYNTVTRTHGVYDELCDYFLLATDHPLRFYHPIEIHPNQGYSNENNIGLASTSPYVCCEGICDYFARETLHEPVTI